jgi:dTDP-4-amino-4,6-dideoxygalactose transaminase
MIERRRARAARYTDMLGAVPYVQTPTEPAFARSNWQTYCVMLGAGLDQRTVMQRMLDAGVATRRGVMCAHREPAYPRGVWRAGSPLTVGESVQDRGVALPLFHDMTDQDQDDVVWALASACEAAIRV